VGVWGEGLMARGRKGESYIFGGWGWRGCGVCGGGGGLCRSNSDGKEKEKNLF